jgi:hypothetical protein
MKGQRKYTPLMRSFALTLHFYSTKAYTYIRRVWGNILPHPSTIRNWYRSVNGSPGFTNEALHAIKLRIADNKNKGKNTICNIVVDEMAIRQQLLFNNRFDGSVEFGADHSEDVDNVPLAKEALVFMCVGINDSWKIPVGYFLISGLPGKKRSMLLKMLVLKNLMVQPVICQWLQDLELILHLGPLVFSHISKFNQVLVTFVFFLYLSYDKVNP